MKKSEKTKNKILKTAMMIFSKQGYHGTTTKEIAKAADVSEGTIFKYYQSKKNLLISGILDFVSNFGQQLFIKSLEEIIDDNEEASFEEILKMIIMSRKELADQYSNYIIVLITEYKNHAEIKDLFKDKFEEEIKDFFEQLIAIGIKKDVLTKEMNHYLFIRSMIGSVMVMLLNHYYFNQWSSGLSFEAEVDSVIYQFINGLK